MAKSWATSTGLDLHLPLAAGARVRVALEQALRDAILSGRLAAGTRGSPPHAASPRTWASRATRSPTRTRSSSPRAGWPPGRARAPGSPSGPARQAPRRARRRASARAWAAYDLRPGRRTSALPAGRLAGAARRALAPAPHEAFGSGDPGGRVELREALAGVPGTRARRADRARADRHLLGLRARRCGCCSTVRRRGGVARRGRGGATVSASTASCWRRPGYGPCRCPSTRTVRVVGGCGRGAGRAADARASVPDRRARCTRTGGPRWWTGRAARAG